MKLLPLFICLSLQAGTTAQDLSPARQRVEQQVAAFPVTARFDQPYAGSDNPKQQLDLYLPKQPSHEDPLPVVVYIHGGGWRNGDRINGAGNVLPLVRSGEFAGVSVGYRLSAEATWPAQIHDCKAAIRWIRGHAKEFNLDPDRIGVWGSSAGGHLVSLLGTSAGIAELEGDLGSFTDLSSWVTCVVNQCGPQDFRLPLMFRDGEPVIEDPAVAGLLGGPLSANAKSAVAASPVTYVTPDDAPFLTLHGTKDQRVDFRHAERIHEALTAAGVPSLLLPVVEGAHGLNHPLLPERIRQFFDRHLRGQVVEIPAEPLLPTPPEPAAPSPVPAS